MTALGLSLLSALALTSLSGCGQPTAPAAAAPTARPVLVAQAEPLPLGRLDFVGEVRALQRAELTFSVPGVVREVLVEPGDRVRAGQVLARLDPL
ncbi:efflux RND transporter periplasmic adaptor subunit, partial [Pelomonas sp. HMWF004]